MNADCVFCKIIKGEIPAYKVYEDEFVLAILDINPLSKGHTLVIPKRHYARLTEMDERFYEGFMRGLQKVLRLIESKLSKDYNIIVNQGKKANQEIEHLHVHIVPRYGQEQIFVWKTHKLTPEEAEEVLKKLRQ
jgi:histidine triad (HIT) family protein